VTNIRANNYDTHVTHLHIRHFILVFMNRKIDFGNYKEEGKPYECEQLGCAASTFLMLLVNNDKHANHPAGL